MRCIKINTDNTIETVEVNDLEDYVRSLPWTNPWDVRSRVHPEYVIIYDDGDITNAVNGIASKLYDGSNRDKGRMWGCCLLVRIGEGYGRRSLNEIALPITSEDERLVEAIKNEIQNNREERSFKEIRKESSQVRDVIDVVRKLERRVRKLERKIYHYGEDSKQRS